MEQNNWNRIIEFLASIGIKVSYKTINDDTFLPGLLIDKSTIFIDKDKLKYPGDILHEAGHIAVVPACDRNNLSADTIIHRKDQAAEEMMAIAWSYAVCKHLEIEPQFVFHESGYKGSGQQIAELFNKGQSFGVPMLQFAGMSAEPRMAETLGLPAFPKMAKWLRD